MTKMFFRVIVLLCVSHHSYSQISQNGKQNSTGHEEHLTIKILNTLKNAKSLKSDTNAFKIYHVQYVLPSGPNVQVPDTVWAPVIGADTSEFNKWHFILRGSNDNLWYSSSTAVSKNGNLITFWTRDWRYYVHNSEIPGYKLNHKLLLCTVDCNQKTYKMLREVDFDNLDRVLKDTKFENDFDYPIPKSVGESVVNYACNVLNK